jgi:NitT/TauT family transport system substrate-binding protein
MKRSLLLIVCLIFINLFAFTGCEKNQAPEHINANVGTWKTAQTIQPFYYHEYLEADDSIKVVPFTNPGDMKTALLSGSMDMCGTTIVTAITAMSKGEPVVIVSGMSNKCSALVVAKKSDILTPADLKGKKIAYVPGTMHHLLLIEALKINGLDIDKDVTLVRIDFFDMGQALSQGIVDAFYSGEPYPSIAVSEDYGRILLYPEGEEGFGIINSAMITTKDKIENEPEVIQKLVTAHVKATDRLILDRDKWLDQAAEFGIDRKILDLSVNNIQLFWDIDESYLKSVEQLAKRMKAQGLISEIPDIEAMFDLSFIKNAEKESQK